jgi:hypothetical protein
MSCRLVSLVVAVALLASLVGCGGGGDNAAAKAQVELMIRSQLPGEVRKNTGEAVFVSDLTCVDKGHNQFDCIAKVTGTNGVGGLQTTSVPISASCDKENCTWRSSQ